MSQKWRRVKSWDDEHLTGALTPVRWVLRAFSSIPLAVILLVGVILYATLASVPIGLLALAPTYAVYALSLVATIAVVAGVPIVAVRFALRARPTTRFVVTLIGGIGLVLLGAWAWESSLWPAMRYDAVSGHGLRLFAGFVDAYKSSTLRRLPGVEMSELEFYSAWPMRLILLAFVLNMAVATIRRIEFVFVNIGVLTVHTGIIVIALGSVYYAGLKKEGDALMLATDLDPQTGRMRLGPVQDSFYDNQRVVLYVNQRGPLEQRLLRGIPRYNDYNLGVLGSDLLSSVTGQHTHAHDDGGRRLDLPVPDGTGESVDPDIALRVVGYASYAEPADDYLNLGEGDGDAGTPLRVVSLFSTSPSAPRQGPDGAVFRFPLEPSSPARRIIETDFISAEYTFGMDDTRWADLCSPLPPGSQHALVVEVPGAGVRLVVPGMSERPIPIGDTGWTVQVMRLMAQPPFPIITPGYEDAPSSMAIVRVTGPEGQSFDRWVYHRFPEISQDMLSQTTAQGMPVRRDADPAIRISYIDASVLQVYYDERPDGSLRGLVRIRGGEPIIVDPMNPEGTISGFAPQMGLSFRVTTRWERALLIERPEPVPERQRDKQMVGIHANAMLAVRVTSDRSPGWSRVVWLPFTQYTEAGMDAARTVDLPDGRRVGLMFGRLKHPLPGFVLQLVDFEMIAYDHRGAPRDYQSLIRVTPTDTHARWRPYTHVTKLNAPLTAPFIWSEDRNWISNLLGRLASGVSPNQFKFSQSGWDRENWARTQAAADRGEVPRPFVTYTILGVGNNPGIHIIALGSVLMGVGIPWAFYVKPWILRRRKRRIQAELAQQRAEPAPTRPAREPELEPIGAES